MERTTPFEQPLLGQTLAGKYKLVEVRAGGAFGAVFRAEQYFCGHFVRPVAVKVSRQTGLNEESAPHLFGDAILLARILAAGDHDGRRHLVQIFDMGLLPEHDGRAYIAMEYVEGAPLLSHMRAAGRVGVAIGLRVLKQICRAMSLVHAQGAVHRDLKSDNILVDRRGVVRVVDFGLASFADRRLGFAPGAMGTFIYMAPETVLGRSTPASDVYSLGLLMYELFTGGGPHLTAPWSTDDRQDHRDEHYRLKASLRFPPPSEVQNEIRNDYRWLDGLILRCLETDPARRLADAGKLLAALEMCEAGGELPPMPAEETAAAGAAARRRGFGPTIPRGAPAAGGQAVRSGDRSVGRTPAGGVGGGGPDGRPDAAALGQAYLGRGDLRAARECLEQLRDAQRQQPLLARPDYAASLSDLYRCYKGLGLAELAKACQEEARGLL